MKKIIQDFKVSNKFFLNSRHFILEIKSPFPLPDMAPGQFAAVHVSGAAGVLLRRPFSIHDFDAKRRTIQFLIKIAGEGTRALSSLEKQDVVNIIYPLGRGFTKPDEGRALLAGGGCGVAPLLFLSRRLHEAGIEQAIILGAMTQLEVLEAEKFEKYGEVLITTIDGTRGEKGLITQHSLWNDIKQFSRIYCCGPEAMMRKVSFLAMESGVDCEVSLENLMACGIGACLCCVTPTVRGHECVCTSGPVFNSKDLKWQI